MDSKDTQAKPVEESINRLREDVCSPAEIIRIKESGLEVEAQEVDQASPNASQKTAYSIPWYELLEEMPGGTFCHVYKARRPGFDKLFVVKILKEELAKDPRVAKRFSIETRKASHTNHANLAPTYEYGTTSNGLPYFITDYIAGEPLSRLIEQKGFFENKEAVEIFIQICDALQEAHGGELLHRHLTPDNVFVTHSDDGVPLVKVTDVGIAKVLPTVQEDESGNINQHHFGDARYMSPEQCRGEKLDERSDIYSLGCLMYHMLGGKPPHKGSSPVFTALKQIEKHPQPLSERFPELEVSLALETVVMRALQKDREFRYQNITELKEDLITVSKAETSIRGKATPLDAEAAGGRKNNRKFQRLYMISVFAIATTLTYTAQLMQLPGTFLSQQGGMPPSYQHSSNKIELFDVYGTDGKAIFSGFGRSLAEVIVAAAKDGQDMHSVDLSGQDFPGLDLSGAKFSGADFSGANLADVNLRGADLRGAQFSSTTLTGAQLDGANMEGAVITDSDLTTSRLYGADLQHSFWRDCNLDYANISTANFNDASVYQVDLPEASRVGTIGLVVQDRFPDLEKVFAITSCDGKTLYESKIKQTFRKTVEEAAQHGVSLSKADFRAADLTGVNLTGADLRGADLRGALLTDAVLTRANLLGANARGAVCNLSETQLLAANVIGWQVFFPAYYDQLPIIERTSKEAQN